MKKFIFIGLILTVFLLSGCVNQISQTQVPKETTNAQEEVCIKQETNEQMSLDEAKIIAEDSECTEEGALTENYICNEFTGTWWIDLEIDKAGCSPACVINVVTKEAEINWRCTGLIPE